MIDEAHKEEDEDACSITTVAESKALLSKWTGQVRDSRVLDRSFAVLLWTYTT